MNNYCVYKHTFPNNKIYIGITCQKPEYRWNSGKGYDNQLIMKRAIKKYGWENIKHEIIYSGLTDKEASDKEIELIALYESYLPSKGYNVSPGGNLISEDGKQRLRKSKLGNKESEETRLKKSVSMKKAYLEGKFKDYDYSFRRSDSFRNNQKEIMLKKWQNPDFREKVLPKFYESVKSSDYRLKQSIRAKEVNNRPEIKAKFSGAFNGKSKSVICLESGDIYACAAEAGRKTNTSVNGICMVCRGERKTVGGYHWLYV